MNGAPKVHECPRVLLDGRPCCRWQRREFAALVVLRAG